jgi:hypothetical protein
VVVSVFAVIAVGVTARTHIADDLFVVMDEDKVAHVNVIMTLAVMAALGRKAVVGGPLGEPALVGHDVGGVPIQLREDYGATFNGTVIVKDTVFNYIWGGTNYDFVLVDAPTAHIYNGYATYFPNLIVDNITVKTDHDSIRLVNISSQVYNQAGDHYPSRCPIRDDVSNPDALFTYYFETANKNIVEDEPAKFPFLEGFKKVNKTPGTLKAGEYTVVDNGNSTYTVIAEGVKNVQPYNAPKFIEIKNMKNAKNVNGKPLQITLYDSPFFKNTEIIDEDKVLKLIKAPKK